MKEALQHEMDRLQRARDEAAAALADLERLWVDGVRLTLVARFPDDDKMTLITTKEPDDAGARAAAMAILALTDGATWPLRDVLAKLVEATEHLLTDHSCDTHGYELFGRALERGREILKEMS